MSSVEGETGNLAEIAAEVTFEPRELARGEGDDIPEEGDFTDDEFDGVEGEDID